MLSTHLVHFREHGADSCVDHGVLHRRVRMVKEGHLHHAKPSQILLARHAKIDIALTDEHKLCLATPEVQGSHSCQCSQDCTSCSALFFQITTLLLKVQQANTLYKQTS